ncbi:hypothetical protein KSP40_PGU015933 [Platanthera guangdongensis]|uniref:Uncharacterized protein n=1 Tax=Platanthera guangdongensis TaxID=2320717 RepID=A0ABR2M1V4_9ASPA
MPRAALAASASPRYRHGCRLDSAFPPRVIAPLSSSSRHGTRTPPYLPPQRLELQSHCCFRVRVASHRFCHARFRFRFHCSCRLHCDVSHRFRPVSDDSVRLHSALLSGLTSTAITRLFFPNAALSACSAISRPPPVRSCRVPESSFATVQSRQTARRSSARRCKSCFVSALFGAYPAACHSRDDAPPPHHFFFVVHHLTRRVALPLLSLSLYISSRHTPTPVRTAARPACRRLPDTRFFSFVDPSMTSSKRSPPTTKATLVILQTLDNFMFFLPSRPWRSPSSTARVLFFPLRSPSSSILMASSSGIGEFGLQTWTRSAWINSDPAAACRALTPRRPARHPPLCSAISPSLPLPAVYTLLLAAFHF